MENHSILVFLCMFLLPRLLSGHGLRQIQVLLSRSFPETMLGDTAVAVNPDDERYTDIIGKKLLLPIVNREIPVIADPYVDKEFPFFKMHHKLFQAVQFRCIYPRIRQA